MHEHIDEMGIINMNGRIYDPLIGRFMSADPYIQAPDDLQSHNRYAYVMNNPLNLDDPSGYFSISRAWKRVWHNPLFKAAIGIVVAIYAPALLNWIAPSLFGASSLATAVATGALSGFASTGTLKGALTGALTAGLMFGAGEIGQALKLESGGLGKIALHAGAGCLSSVAGGGSCKSGAISGALGEAGLNIKTEGIALGAVKGAMLGGIGSKLAGGKFADGAQTGAFGYLFNECMHTKACGFGGTESYSGSDPLLDKSGRVVSGGDGKPVLMPMGTNMEAFAKDASISDLGKFSRGGSWDLQTQSSLRSPGENFEQRYIDAATVAIGVHAAAAGIPLNVSLGMQNINAGSYRNSYTDKFPLSDDFTRLPLRNIQNTKIGYGLYK